MVKFAELWAANEYECRATVATDRMEISVVVDTIGSKCHMTSVQVTGMYCDYITLIYVMCNCGLIDFTELANLCMITNYIHR